MAAWCANQIMIQHVLASLHRHRAISASSFTGSCFAAFTSILDIFTNRHNKKNKFPLVFFFIPIQTPHLAPNATSCLVLLVS